MKMMFSRLGIPEIVRSDNGTQYSSREFKQFATSWGFDHVTSSPEYPRSNGMAERHVQTVKDLLTKAKDSGKDPYLVFPAQLICGRGLRSILPYSQQSLKIKTTADDVKYVENKQVLQDNQAKYYNVHTKQLGDLNIGEEVRMLKNGQWRHAVVQNKCEEPRSFIIKTEDGKPSEEIDNTIDRLLYIHQTFNHL